MEMKLRMCALALNGFSCNTTVSAMQQRNNIDDFNLLINVHCSCFTRLFVCLTHYPFCSADAKIPLLLPCRSVCEDVFDNCIKYYIALNLDWPQHLNCSNFRRHSALCIKPSSSTPSSISPTTSAQEPATHHFISSRSTSTPKTTSPTLASTFSPSPNIDNDTLSFLLFISHFLPKLMYSLAFVFIFVCVLVSLPFFGLVTYFCAKPKEQGQYNRTPRGHSPPGHSTEGDPRSIAPCSGTMTLRAKL